MKDWFTIDKIDDTTYIISEYRHWEETHCYLLIGSERCLLIDTRLGICNIYEQVRKLTDEQKALLIKRVTEVSSEIMNIPQEFFTTMITELPDKNFGIGGKTIDVIKKEYKHR